MVTDTGKTIENPKEYLKKKAEDEAKYLKENGLFTLGCTTQQICPECGAVLYDSPCFHFFTDCPRCGYHQEPWWKSMKSVPVGEWQIRDIAGDGIGYFDNFKYQG